MILTGGIPKNYVYICLLWGRYELWDIAIWRSNLLENSTGHWNLAFVPCQTLWEQDDVMWVCRGLTNGTADENLMLVISIFGELTLSRVLFCKTKTNVSTPDWSMCLVPCWKSGALMVNWSLEGLSLSRPACGTTLEGVWLGPVSELMFMFGFSFSDAEDEFTQLRRIGDKLNFWQRLLNFISKLFNSVTWVHQTFLPAGTPKKEVPPVGTDVYYGMDSDVMDGGRCIPDHRSWMAWKWISSRKVSEAFLWAVITWSHIPFQTRQEESWE